MDNAKLPGPRVGVDWSVAAPLLAVHVLALGLAPFTVTAAGLWTCAALYLFTGFGVTAGAHRLFTHRAFVAAPAVREVLAFAFLLSAQGSLRRWVRDHEQHHRYTDAPGDPHSPREAGFFYAHLGWLWRKPATPEEDRALYRRFTRHVEPGVVGGFFRSAGRLTALHLAAMAAATAAGCLAGGLRASASVLVWGFFVRTALVLHSTLLVNSAAHLWGGRRYQTGDDARNLGWVALLSLGEGFHNNHHHRPAAANHGFHAAYELDATFLVIAALGAVGLARDLKVYRAGRVQIWFPSGAAR